MLHARPRVVPGRHALPALILGVCTLAFAGLALTPAATGADPDVVAYADSQPVPLLTPEEIERERGAARASRGRRVAEAQAQAEAAAAAAAAQAAAAAAQAEAEAKAKAEAEAARLAKATVCPVPSASFTDTWGAARSGGRAHKGTDLLAPYGAPVYAVVTGRVKTASSSLGGISLYLQGNNGETYFYAHNSANVASNGERVQAGDLIAKVGSTGNAGGTNHVHFERQVGGRSVNPYSFLRKIC